MPETIQKCPLCEGQTSSFFNQREFRGHEVVNQICNLCGLVYQSPRMTTAELDDFYTAQYRQVYQGIAGPTPKDVFVQNGRADSLLTFIADSIPDLTRYLDIGCSTGLLLKRFQERYACQVVGIEPGDAYRTYAKAQGLTVYPEVAALESAGEERFNLISLAHVLEHLPDPVAFLINLREQHLTTKSWLLIEVPNLYVHDSFELAHMTSFSAHTLRQVLKKAGFEVIALKKHGQPRSELLSLYLTVLAQPREVQKINFVVHPERRVVQQRQLGMFTRRVIQYMFPNKAWVSLPEEENL